MNENETMNSTGQAGEVQTAEEQDAKTFTQADVNKIVQERLQRERTKTEASLAAREQDVTAREFRSKAAEIMTAKKLPVELLDALNATDETSLNKALDILDSHFNFSNPNLSYTRNPDGTWHKFKPGDPISMPPVGSIDIPDSNMCIRDAMGLRR